jgi:hypothetical protein
MSQRATGGDPHPHELSFQMKGLASLDWRARTCQPI